MSATKRPGIEKGSPMGPTGEQLMELVVSRPNMLEAYRRVVKNKGSAGVDGMTVGELKEHLATNWEAVKVALLNDDYYPSAVRRVTIPKPSGGERHLGIPTVMDRVIQQALHQVLSPIYDPTFSDNSYGFRPGRSAHQAVLQSQAYINEDKRWVVDVDLSKFFDEVNHDRLLGKLRKVITDKRVIHLIDRYLRTGILADGLVERRAKGTPQGSPLSPLLSNIVLDELDQELERRGLRLVRYADDFQIYVGTRRSADRVMASIAKFIKDKLRLKVNVDKSEVGRPWDRSFLGYGFTTNKSTKLKPSKVSIKRLRQKVKAKFRRGKGRNLTKFIREELNPMLRGWANYFSLSETKGWMTELDSWVRRRLRGVKWRQWKRNWTRKEGLMQRGLSEEQAVRSAFNRLGPWFNAGASHMNLAFPKSYYDRIGLVTITGTITKSRTDRESLGTAVIRNRTSGGVRGPGGRQLPLWNPQV